MTKRLSQQTQKLQNFIKTHQNLEQKNEQSISPIYQELIDCITDHNHQYYIENKPIISDKDYDELFGYLKKVEEYFPHLISGDSPTQKLVNQIQE